MFREPNDHPLKLAGRRDPGSIESVEATITPPARSRLALEAGCDFYCHRFRVWYPSIDCALRTRDQNYEGCSACDQGRFNLRRHAETLWQQERPSDVKRRRKSRNHL